MACRFFVARCGFRSWGFDVFSGSVTGVVELAFHVGHGCCAGRDLHIFVFVGLFRCSESIICNVVEVLEHFVMFRRFLRLLGMLWHARGQGRIFCVMWKRWRVFDAMGQL